ncbi:MAG: PrsW family glutamic-type intramembrane protease, partial [Halobacteria archaeon]|nr:PrsW family glutamic-type intramembrane protease [Halobacteria archaeon]
VYLNGFGSEILEISRETLRIGYAPVVEEFAKALPLFVLLVVFPAFMKKKEVILAALFSGIGFSVVENYLYMINRINEGAFAIIRTVFTRSIST